MKANRSLLKGINHALSATAEPDAKPASKPPALGTVLPTAESLAINAEYRRKRNAQNDTIAASHPILSKLIPYQVHRETRYHHPSGKYAVVGMNDGRVKWFETRQDGMDYATSAPETT